MTSHGGECYEFNLLLEANQLTLSQAVSVRWCHLEQLGAKMGKSTQLV